MSSGDGVPHGSGNGRNGDAKVMTVAFVRGGGGQWFGFGSQPHGGCPRLLAPVRTSSRCSSRCRSSRGCRCRCGTHEALAVVVVVVVVVAVVVAATANWTKTGNRVTRRGGRDR
jgi:hypothetical protein